MGEWEENKYSFWLLMLKMLIEMFFCVSGWMGCMKNEQKSHVNVGGGKHRVRLESANVHETGRAEWKSFSKKSSFLSFV
jgi:hypothetical protein